MSVRRSSLGILLRRSKSGELKKKGLHDQEIPKSPPRLPVLYNGAPAPNLDGSFGNNSSDGERDLSASPTDHYNSNYTPRPSMDPTTAAIGVPVPPLPNGNWVDPYARTESMTHRGRYSYASSAISTVNSPRRVRRRKDPTPFNVLIVGTRASGKTSFLEFLKTSLALPAKKRTKQHFDADEFVPITPPTGNFSPHFVETEIDGERIGLTLWDSESLEKNVVDLQLREMSAFLESKFEDTFNEEMKVVRSPGAQDTHIHAVFLILDPARLDRNIAASKTQDGVNGYSNGQNGGPVKSIPDRILGALDEDLDLQVLRTLQGKTTVIPVISKADTITTKHMNVLKKSVYESLKKSNLDPLEALGLDDYEDGDTIDSNRIDEESEEEVAAANGKTHTSGVRDSEIFSDASAYPESENPALHIQGARDSYTPTSQTSRGSKRLSTASLRRNKEDDDVPYIPMSIISPDIYEPGVAGRQFPWGFADPNNEDHCDFLRLKDAVFGDWRGELREASREQWYEGWRTNRLKQRDGSKGVKASLRR